MVGLIVKRKFIIFIFIVIDHWHTIVIIFSSAFFASASKELAMDNKSLTTMTLVASG